MILIPGVILGQDGHAFLQVMNGVDGTTAYLEFPLTDFRADDRKFSIGLDKNRFNERHLHLELDAAGCQLECNIQLGPLNPWPVTWFSPGIMGWFAWFPQIPICSHPNFVCFSIKARSPFR